MLKHTEKALRRALALEGSEQPLPPHILKLCNRYEQLLSRVSSQSGLTTETQVMLALLTELTGALKPAVKKKPSAKE